MSEDTRALSDLELLAEIWDLTPNQAEFTIISEVRWKDDSSFQRHMHINFLAALGENPCDYGYCARAWEDALSSDF